MNLTLEEALRRLETSDFGVLGTPDPDRGIHLVPVVFVVDGSMLMIPVDAVKQKSSLRLRRIRNLERDNVATLLVDHRSPDWGSLWWVSTGLRFRRVSEPSAEALALLGAKYPPYRAVGSVAAVIELEIQGAAGWDAAPSRLP